MAQQNLNALLLIGRKMSNGARMAPGALTAPVAAVCEAYQHAPTMAEAGGHGISTDEKTGVSALERAVPTLSLESGRVERPE